MEKVYKTIKQPVILLKPGLFWSSKNYNSRHAIVLNHIEVMQTRERKIPPEDIRKVGEGPVS